jgi:hypothetical protein
MQKGEMERIMAAAKLGNTTEFLQSVKFVEPDSIERTIILKTRHLFATRPQPNIFEATDEQELEAAFREASETKNVEMACATPVVHELAKRARMANPRDADYAASEIYLLAYRMKNLLRIPE